MFLDDYKYKKGRIVAQFNPSLSIRKKLEATDLLISYDWYTAYIDDGQQFKMAEGKNKHFIEALEDLGCIKFELLKDDNTVERKAI